MDRGLRTRQELDWALCSLSTSSGCSPGEGAEARRDEAFASGPARTDAADAEAPDTEVRPLCSGAIASLQSGILSLFSTEQESASASLSCSQHAQICGIDGASSGSLPVMGVKTLKIPCYRDGNGIFPSLRGAFLETGSQVTASSAKHLRETGLCASTWIVHEGSKACARDPGLRRKSWPLFWAFAAGFSPPRQAIFPRV